MKPIESRCLAKARLGRRAPCNSRRTKPLVEALEERALLAVTIQFDYSLDKSGVFANPENVAFKQALEEAGRDLSRRLGDHLLAIRPSGNNHWVATFTDPGTGAEKSIRDPVVPADTLIVYVGMRELGGDRLGRGGSGGFILDSIGNRPTLE